MDTRNRHFFLTLDRAAAGSVHLFSLVTIWFDSITGRRELCTEKRVPCCLGIKYKMKKKKNSSSIIKDQTLEW